MFCLVYIGSSEGLRYWRARVQLHGSWLGLNTALRKWRINPQREGMFASFHSFPISNLGLSSDIINPDVDIMLRENTGIWSLEKLLTKDAYDRAITSFDWREMWIVISGHGENLYVWRGLTSVGQIYYCCDKNSIVISNDFRLLMPKNKPNLDPAGIYSLFQFGAVSAPFTLSKNIKCVPPGYLIRFHGQSLTEQFMPYELAPFHDSPWESNSPEVIMEKALSDEINKIPTHSALLFSGGVDSGLLAALAKRNGRSDLRLINCDFTPCFGPDFTDPEAKLARDMATHLGYKLDVFQLETSSVPKMLSRIGTDYTFPFGDYSTIPTNIVSDYATSLLNRGSWIVDGTGSDGTFLGIQFWKRLNRIYRLPLFIRRLLALLFQNEKIYYSSNLLSRFFGAVSLSLQMPPLQSHLIAQNRLGGIAFLAEKESMQEVLSVQNNYLQILVQGVDHRMQLSWLDLIHICVGIYAAKDYEPIRHRGLFPFFPFLGEKCITAGHYIMKNANELRENKRVLKSLLSRDVPYEMIYRPKSGFSPPIGRILRSHIVNEYLNDIILKSNNPVHDFIFPRVVEKLYNKILNGKQVYNRHVNFLWSYIFVSIWFDQQLKSYTEPAITF